jgi:hypothetical protein
MTLDKPSARIYYGENHGVKPTPQTPRPPKPPSQSEHAPHETCDHLYREFRVENASGVILTVFFYCQKCLDIQIKKIKL